MKINTIALLFLSIVSRYCTYIDQRRFDVYAISDGFYFGQYNVNDVFHTISYGELTFYDNFVTSYHVVHSKHRRNAHLFKYSVNDNISQWLKISLLLCGDIHPCPGPRHTVDYSKLRKRGIHFIHLNIRSLLPKIDEVRLQARDSNASCILLTETWLDESVCDAEVNIDGYTIQRKDRNRQGGGVCIYIRNDFAFNTRDDLSSPDLEALFIDILLPKTKPILCGVCYRPPKQLNFYDLLESLFLECSSVNENESVILGDFNTDVSSKTGCSLNKSLKSFCDLFSFIQIIQDFTRVTPLTSTTIDLILVSDPVKISQHGVINCCLSDHQMTFCTRKICRDYVGKHNNVTVRSLKHYEKESFQQSLLSQDWSSVLLCDNVNNAWESFKSIFVSVLDNIAPVKSVRIKQRTEGWIDSTVLECIKARDKAFHNFRKDKSEDNFNHFKNLRNKANSAISVAKKNYFKQSLEENKQDSKSLWKCLKELGLPSKTGQSATNIGLNIEGNICFDKSVVAEKFNSFYVTVAEKLVSKLPRSVSAFGENFVFNFYRTKGIRPKSFSFSIVTEFKVLKYLNKLSPNKATGLDGIPSRFIRDSAPIIAGPLAHIINLSVIQGVVPDDLKTARVVPLFKKNDKTDVGNYRPVSILSTVSKIFERVIYDQLEEYLANKNVLYDYQSGFRKGMSTDTCLIHLTDFIRLQMDKGHFVGMLLLDLQKAFDTVNHEILLTKLRAIGLTDNAVMWLSSYLSNRMQLVENAGVLSSSAPIKCGVPQGSILGPLLFLIYVNDMSAVVRNKLLLYADDSAILVSGKDKKSIEDNLSSDLHLVSQWLITNKLSLHLGKTESILFGSHRRVNSQSPLDIKCNGQAIESKTSVKYLGATIDQFLSFETMARSVIKKSCNRLKFLYRKKEFLTSHTKKLLVSSLIQCHFDYASSAWFNGLTKDLKHKLQVTQNKIIRFVLDLHPRSHIGKDEFNKLKWLPVSSRVNQTILCHVYKIHNGLSPQYLTENFTPVSSVHEYPTRFRSKTVCSDSGYIFKDSARYSVPNVKGFGQKTFLYNGCMLWNGLPQVVRDAKTLSAFKVKVKDHFLSIDF